MADPLEQASDLEELERALAINAARAAVGTGIRRATGKCHNCNEPVGAGAIFCDDDCRDDFDARVQAQKRK